MSYKKVIKNITNYLLKIIYECQQEYLIKKKSSICHEIFLMTQTNIIMNFGNSKQFQNDDSVRET
jgi:hypothetical protein